MSPERNRAMEAIRNATDEELVLRIRAGDAALYEILMRRHNERLYRAVRAIVRNESEVEDILQEAYLAAYRALADFEGRARFSTWLVRIAVNKALDRRKRRAHVVELHPGTEATTDLGAHAGAWDPTQNDPERRSARRELAHLLETAIDGLPERFRGVYVLREIEGLDTQETAEVLGLELNTVKTRLHRARALLRQSLSHDIGAAALQAFPFGASRCDRLVESVMGQLMTPSS